MLSNIFKVSAKRALLKRALVSKQFHIAAGIDNNNNNNNNKQVSHNVIYKNGKHNIFLLPCRDFSEAKPDDDSFFSMNKFKSMFGGATPKKDETGSDGKKQTVLGGFKEGFNSKLEERKVKQENEQFHFFYDELVKAEDFDSLTYLKIMKTLMKQGGAEGIRGKIANVTGVGKEELAVFKANVQILENFKKKELSEVGYLNIMSKRRVMKDTGHSLEQINQVCKNYFEIKMLHNWVRRHHGNGGTRPDSMAEAHRLIKQDGDLDTHFATAWGGVSIYIIFLLIYIYIYIYSKI